MKQGVSIVVPFLNENEGIEAFCAELDGYAQKVAFSIELVFVDDGSTDNTSQIIRNYAFHNIDKVQLIVFSKNFGSHAAVRAGITKAHYDICTWIGSDLQEPIEFIDLAYQRIISGEDAVYIEKKSIKIPIIERLFSKTYSGLMRKFAVSNYSSNGINNIMFNGKIKQLLNENIESNSALILQIMDSGFNYSVITLDYKERSFGKSKWTLSKKIKLFIDSFVAFSFMPIRMVSIMGIIISLIGFIFGAVIIINKISNPASPVPGYPSLACLIVIGFGLTNISLGIIAEYLWRAYDCARRRPVFIISEAVQVKDGANNNDKEYK